MSMAAYETVIVEKHHRVGIITLNRPQALNALNTATMNDVLAASSSFDNDEAIGCMLVIGSEKAFAAGADIREMSTKTAVEMRDSDFFGGWERFAALRKPVVAAVSGVALGGGCELAMMCDVILAADNARFGQPEIKIGVIPGMGGGQRLTRLVGRTKAMDLCLTGRMMDATEALASGLVSRVVPTAELRQTALNVAAQISELPLPALIAIKESIRQAEETSLSDGIRFERRKFHMMFETHDQREGMTAFLEKRAPSFLHK